MPVARRKQERSGSPTSLRSRSEALAQYRTGSEQLHVCWHPDQAGMRLTVSHTWMDGKPHPLSRAWRTKVLRQLGFPVARWNKTDWGEQAVFEGAAVKSRNPKIKKVKA